MLLQLVPPTVYPLALVIAATVYILWPPGAKSPKSYFWPALANTVIRPFGKPVPPLPCFMDERLRAGLTYTSRAVAVVVCMCIALVGSPRVLPDVLTTPPPHPLYSNICPAGDFCREFGGRHVDKRRHYPAVRPVCLACLAPQVSLSACSRAGGAACEGLSSKPCLTDQTFPASQ